MKKIKSMIIGILLIISILTVLNPVSAATREVGPGKTYATITAAITAASPGDTIMVYPGTYNEYVNITVQNLTLESVGGRDVTTIGPGTDDDRVININGNLGTITIDGFTIIMSDTIILGIAQGRAAGPGTTVHVLNNKIVASNKMMNGMQITGTNSQIIGNLVYGAPFVVPWQSTGIYVLTEYTQENVLVKDNHIIGGDYGIGIDGGWGGVTSDVVVYNNTIEECTWGAISFGGKVKNTLVENNIIKDNVVGILDDHRYIELGYSDENPTNTKINHNEFYNNQVNVEIIGDYESGYILDATYNWWGSNAGPAPGSLIGPINYSPWESHNTPPSQPVIISLGCIDINGSTIQDADGIISINITESDDEDEDPLYYTCIAYVDGGGGSFAVPDFNTTYSETLNTLGPFDDNDLVYARIDVTDLTETNSSDVFTFTIDTTYCGNERCDSNEDSMSCSQDCPQGVLLSHPPTIVILPVDTPKQDAPTQIISPSEENSSWWEEVIENIVSFFTSCKDYKLFNISLFQSI